MGHTYSLGAVKPWVRNAAQEVGDKFDVSTIYGVGIRPDATSDHPKGLALDYMVYSDKAKGDEIAAYFKANWSRLSVKYIIWYDREDDGNGWYNYGQHGSPTLNHMDHVHVSFTNSGGGSTYTGTADSTTQDTGSTTDSTAGLSAFTSSSTWFRVLEFIGGVALLAFMLWKVVNKYA